MLPVISEMAQEYKASLQGLYGNELAELVLFGSYARGDYHEESDVDFAVVLLNPNTTAYSEIIKTNSISSQLWIKYGIPVSSIHMSLLKKQTSMQGIYQEIRKDGIVI